MTQHIQIELHQRQIKYRGVSSLLLGVVSVLLPMITGLVTWRVTAAHHESFHWAVLLLAFLLMGSSIIPATVGLILGVKTIRSHDAAWLAGLLTEQQRTGKPASRRKAVAGIVLSLLNLSAAALVCLLYVFVIVLFAFQGGHHCALADFCY